MRDIAYRNCKLLFCINRLVDESDGFWAEKVEIPVFPEKKENMSLQRHHDVLFWLKMTKKQTEIATPQAAMTLTALNDCTHAPMITSYMSIAAHAASFSSRLHTISWKHMCRMFFYSFLYELHNFPFDSLFFYFAFFCKYCCLYFLWMICQIQQR